MIRAEPDYRAIADEVSALNAQIDELQQQKKDIFGNVRDSYGKNAADALKLAIKMAGEDETKRAAREDVESEAIRILQIIRSPRAPRAMRTREKIEKIPPHDPVTGEITEQHSSVPAPSPADEQAGAHRPIGAPADNSLPQPTSSREADKAGDAPPPASPAAIYPDPHLLAAADGRPSIPNDPAAGAKSDGVAAPSSVGAGAAPGIAFREGSYAVPDFVPAFLIPADALPAPKPRPHRPHCLRPELCAGQGNKHCHSCEKAAAAQGVAA